MAFSMGNYGCKPLYVESWAPTYDWFLGPPSKGIYQATLHFKGTLPRAQVTMLIMVAGVTVFAEGLAGNVQKALSCQGRE